MRGYLRGSRPGPAAAAAWPADVDATALATAALLTLALALLPRTCSFASASANIEKVFYLTDKYAMSGIFESVANMQEGKTQEVESRVCKLENQSFAHFPAVWSELRSKQQFCDVAIRCNDTRVFPVHRTILSAVSPYFKKLFTYSPDGMMKTTTDGAEEPVFVLNEVPADLFGLILDYAYTGTCHISVENVERLLPLADCLQIDDVVKLCCRFLVNELTPSNCLGICKFARFFLGSESGIEKQMHQFVCQNFKAILEDGAELKRLTVDELEQILRDDEIDCRGEERIFESIKLWVEASQIERQSHLPRLLGCVRFGLMKSRYFHSNVFPWCLEQNLACSEILMTVANQLGTRPSIQGSIHWSELKENLVWPRMSHQLLFAIGGYFQNPVSYVETYDIRSNSWVMRADDELKAIAYHGVCELNNQIYVIGGCHGGTELSASVCSFDLLTKKWRNRCSMLQVRGFVSVCVNGGKIYALGGKHAVERLNSCERYDPTENQWEYIAPMNHERSDAAAASLGGRVYVAGGFDGYEVHDSCEVYDPASNQWSLIQPMSVRRSGNSLVAYRDCLYVIGGFDGRSRLFTAEKYDPNEPDKWQPIIHMETARSNFAAAVFDDMIFVIGGFSGSAPIETVECYEADSNRWCFAAPMGLERSALSCCVVGGLGYDREYFSRHKKDK